MSYDNSAYVGVDWSHWDATRSLVEAEVRHSLATKLENLLKAAEFSEQPEHFCSGVKAAISVVLGVKVTDEVYPNQINLFE